MGNGYVKIGYPNSRKTQCPMGHPYAGSNLRIGFDGSRRCRECERSARQKREAKRHPLYTIWKAMRQRCNNSSHHHYRWYGAKGVRVCERWQSFDAFLMDMGPRPDGCSIDRIDPDGNYEPNNCRWATILEQRHNRRTA